jgi:O-antigen/teichoic acid export membrane protein
MSLRHWPYLAKITIFPVVSAVVASATHTACSDFVHRYQECPAIYLGKIHFFTAILVPVVAFCVFFLLCLGGEWFARRLKWGHAITFALVGWLMPRNRDGRSPLNEAHYAWMFDLVFPCLVAGGILTLLSLWLFRE